MVWLTLFAGVLSISASVVAVGLGLQGVHRGGQASEACDPLRLTRTPARGRKSPSRLPEAPSATTASATSFVNPHRRGRGASASRGRVRHVTDYLRADLSHSRFEEVDFSQSRFHNVYFQDTVIRGAWLQRVEIDGFVEEVTINGVDVGPLIEAELDRRDPDRRLIRPNDAEGFREAWKVETRRWDATVLRAARLPENLLHERVDGEWSFIETLRHLVFATDAWVLRAILGDPTPYHPLGLPHTELPADTAAVLIDPTARPSLDEILTVRSHRMATVAALLADMTDERLADLTKPVLEPGYPSSESFPVRRCLVVCP